MTLNTVLAAIAMKGGTRIELEAFVRLFESLTVEQQAEAICDGWAIQIDLARCGFSIVASDGSERPISQYPDPPTENATILQGAKP